MTEIVSRTDKDWEVIDGELCRVEDFKPWARVEDGRLTRTFNKTSAYASLVFECDRLPHKATGFITHRLDFLHLWNAFIDRGIGEDEEVSSSGRRDTSSAPQA